MALKDSSALKVGNISKVVRQKCRLNQNNAKLLSHNTSTNILDTAMNLKTIEAYLYKVQLQG